MHTKTIKQHLLIIISKKKSKLLWLPSIDTQPQKNQKQIYNCNRSSTQRLQSHNDVNPFNKSLAKILSMQNIMPEIWQLGCIIWRATETEISILSEKLPSIQNRKAIQTIVQKKIHFILCEPKSLQARILQIAAKQSCVTRDTAQYCQNLLNQCIYKQASDLHIEALDNTLQLRARIDGVLCKLTQPAYINHKQLINHIKVLANCDIAESRRPQDGRFTLNTKYANCDVRLNSCPTIQGEKLALRILNKQHQQQNWHELGMGHAMSNEICCQLQQTGGLILCVGPTGSGKTTTLYSALKLINDGTRNIVTIEDPVEYQLDGINQIAINSLAGLDFAQALRASLRQDPDVILIGEIRDKETAKIAISAALTGHLVLSTLHSKDTWQTLLRLRQLEIDPDLICSSLRCIIAQRLCRKICTHCRKQQACEYCTTGYSGRIALFEYLKITPEISSILTCDLLPPLPPNDCTKYITLKQYAAQCIANNITDTEEINRILGDCK